MVLGYSRVLYDKLEKNENVSVHYDTKHGGHGEDKILLLSMINSFTLQVFKIVPNRA